jgi:hypothetical protein
MRNHQKDLSRPGESQVMKINTGLLLCLVAASLLAAEAEKSPVPASTVDRVGFPKDYLETFQVLRTVTKTNEQKVVTIYGNKAAASVTNSVQLPYPYGSVIVMETVNGLKDAQGKPLLDAQGNLQKDKVAGLHIMRREKGFGQAYGENRAGEWEFVEYRIDGSYITPPEKSGACAECHLKATAKWDFVYRGKLRDGANK